MREAHLLPQGEPAVSDPVLKLRYFVRKVFSTIRAQRVDRFVTRIHRQTTIVEYCTVVPTANEMNSFVMEQRHGQLERKARPRFFVISWAV